MQARSTLAHECSLSDSWNPCICSQLDRCVSQQLSSRHAFEPAQENPNDQRGTNQMLLPRKPMKQKMQRLIKNLSLKHYNIANIVSK